MPKNRDPIRNALLEAQKLERRTGNVGAVKRAVGAVRKDKPKGLTRIADILSRPIYFETAFFDTVRKDGIGSAIKKGAREFMDPKDAMMWGDALAKWYPDTDFKLHQMMPAVFSKTGKGWKLREGGWIDIGLRGTVGVGLDVFADPTTYLTFGTGKALGTHAPRMMAKVGGVIEAIPLTKAAAKEHAAIARGLEGYSEKVAGRYIEKLIKRQLRDAGVDPKNKKLLIEFTQEQTKEFMMKRHAVADLTARRAATRQMVKLHTLAEMTDPGGLKWAGKTIIPGAAFSRSKAVLTTKADIALQRTIPATVYQKMVKAYGKGKAGYKEIITKNVDRYLRTIRAGAAEIPGYREARLAYRARSRQDAKGIEKLVTHVTKDWDKIKSIKWGGREYTVSQFASNHMLDPVSFPGSKLPPMVRVGIQRAKHALEVNKARLMRAGAVEIDEPIWYVISHNTEEELLKLAEKHTLPENARRYFKNMSYMDAAEQLKAAGVAEPKFEEEFANVLTHILTSQSRTLAVSDLLFNVARKYGVSDRAVQEQAFIRALPGVREMLLGHPNFAVEKAPFYAPGSLAMKDVRIVGLETPETAVSKLGVRGIKNDSIQRVGEALVLDPGVVAEAKQIQKLVAKMTPQESTLYWLGRLRNVQDYKELAAVMEHKKALPGIHGDLFTKVQGLVDDAGKDFLGEMGQRFKGVKYLNKGIAGTPDYTSKWYFPEEVANDVVQMLGLYGPGKVPEHARKFVDILSDLNLLGRSIITFWPSFHGRNAYNNVLTGLGDIGLAAINPITHWNASKLVMGADGTLVTPYKRYTYDEIRYLLESHGVTQGRDWLLEQTRRATPKGTAITRPIQKASQAPHFRASRALQTKIEEKDKAVLFMTHLQRGLSPEQAALRVQHFLLDYDDLGWAEREVLRRVMLFPTWHTKNLWSVVPTIITTRPGAMSSVVKLGDHERGPARDVLPEYMRGDFKIKILRKGKLHYITNIDLPYQVLEYAWIPGLTGGPTDVLAKNLYLITPFLKSPLELGTNRDLLTGQSFEAQQFTLGVGRIFSKSPKWLQQWLELNRIKMGDGSVGYTINRTKAMLILRSLAFARLTNASEIIAQKDTGTMEGLLYLTAGTRFREFDIDEAQKRQAWNRRERLKRELRKRLPYRELEIPR